LNCSFIENSTKTLTPQFALFSTNAPYSWTPAHTEAFSVLKLALTTASVLQPFDPEAQSVLITDASKYALGSSLMLVKPKALGLKPVAFSQ
jgi:hypothetical protein